MNGSALPAARLVARRAGAMVTCRPFEGGRGFCGGALGACGARPMATVAAIFSW